MYTFLYRTVPHPNLTVFDAPDGVVSTTRRPRSNTALQALLLLNDSSFFESAIALGGELADAIDRSDEERLFEAFERVLSRVPEFEEVELLLRLLDQERDEPGAVDPVLWEPLSRTPADAHEALAWSMVSRVLLNLDEFITRE